MVMKSKVGRCVLGLVVSVVVMVAFIVGSSSGAVAEDFGGLSTTLDECIAIALERNYRLQAKRAELKGVLLQADAIGIAIMPKLDLKAGATYTTPLSEGFDIGEMFPQEFWDEVGGRPEDSGYGEMDEVQTNWGATLSAAYPFITPYAEKAIKSELKARKEEVLSIVDEARGAATAAYMNALLSQRSLEVAEKSLELAEEQHRNAKLRFENKVAPWFEVIQAEVAVSLAKEKLEQSKNAKKNSLKALYLSMGLSSGPDSLILEPDPIDDIGRVIAEIENTEMPGFPEAFVEESYTYLQLGYSIESLSSQISANRNLPTISAYLTWLGQDGNPMQEPNTYVLGINLNFRLFDSGEAKNRMEQLAVQKEILEIGREEYAQGYLNRLEVLSNDLQVALLTYETAKKTLEAATEGLKIATIGYREGITTSLELMDSRTQYLNADFNLFAKKVAIFLAYDAIRQAIGYERYRKVAVVDVPVDEPEPEDTAQEGETVKPVLPAIEIGRESE